MKIFRVENGQDKRKYMPLLLLADEQESMVEKYIDRVTMYILDDGGVKGEIAVLELPDGILEIKNLDVLPECQKQGYGKKLVDFVCETYKGSFQCVTVGTGDSGLTVPFYEKYGFVFSHVVEHFFTDNYDHPIVENGRTLDDMIYLKKSLK